MDEKGSASQRAWNPVGPTSLSEMSSSFSFGASFMAAGTAYAVHGAIGITEEHALGLFTNRLHEWRMTPGTEGRCAQQLGEALLADNGLSFADFTRTRLTPTLPMVAR